MLARTEPTLLDLSVALFSGLAGSYALCRKSLSTALPGVAIAVALVPPLAAFGLFVGYDDISNAWGALDQSYQYVGFESIDGTKVKSKVSGGIWTDEVDSCDSCSGTANLLACDVPALTEGKGATP